MPTTTGPKYNLTPLTFSVIYASALRKAGHGEVRGWHSPAGNAACVEMVDGSHFMVNVGAGNIVGITPITD